MAKGWSYAAWDKDGNHFIDFLCSDIDRCGHTTESAVAGVKKSFDSTLRCLFQGCCVVHWEVTLVAVDLFRVQLDCRACIRTRKINLPTNQKERGYDTFETTAGKLSARRIQICPDYFCLGIIFESYIE